MMMVGFMIVFMGAIVVGGIMLLFVATFIAQGKLSNKQKYGDHVPEKIKRGATSYVVLDDGEIMEVVTQDRGAIHAKD